MITTEKIKITVDVIINASLEKVWNYWTQPRHIIQWNHASDDWHTTYAENDLKTGGIFMWRMEAKDGSMGFDFTGEFGKIVTFKMIEYTLADDRKVTILFESDENETRISETFEAEQTNSIELQQGGWQAILNNFKKYVETSDRRELLHFEIEINALVEKVYNSMLNENEYKEWTSAFNPTSYFKGSWEKGSKMLFLGTDQDGTVGGVVSKIRENIPNKFLSIEHLGLVKDGREITSGPETEIWAGALENYSFTVKNGKTLLAVDMDSTHDFESYFKQMWPKALQKIKEICEKY